MTSTGRVAATTLNQSCQTSGLDATRPCRMPKGQSLFQNSTTTARMAPSWMTTRNMDMNSSLALKWMSCSTRIIWPVDEMGSHSVMPSTMPIRMAFNISKNIWFLLCSAKRCADLLSISDSPFSIPYYAVFRTEIFKFLQFRPGDSFSIYLCWEICYTGGSSISPLWNHFDAGSSAF